MDDLPRTARRAAAALLVATAAALVTACGGAQAQRQGELASLAAMLPGTYDNRDQAAASGADMAALRLAIVPVEAPMVGDHLYYLQEMAADDPRRVTAQIMLSLEITPEGEIVQGVYQLSEPGRWRDGHDRPDLFRSLLPQDLRLADGCDLEWRVDGRGFAANNDPSSCRVTHRATGRPARRDSRIELTEDGIAFADTVIDDGGRRDPPETRWYRFRRLAP
jgi:hypothetical protein